MPVLILTKCRRLIDRIERGIVRKYNFVLDVHFYCSLGYGIRRAWTLAKNTL